MLHLQSAVSFCHRTMCRGMHVPKYFEGNIFIIHDWRNPLIFFNFTIYTFFRRLAETPNLTNNYTTMQ